MQTCKNNFVVITRNSSHWGYWNSVDIGFM